MRNQFDRVLVRRLIALGALVTMTAASFAAQSPGPPDIDTLIGLEHPREAVISPDGLLVAYVVESTNWDDNRYDRHIVLTSTGEGAEPIRLTRGEGSSYRPRFYTDSASIAFLSDRDGTTQIYRISLSGGDAHRLTTQTGGVLAFEIASDDSLVFSARSERSPELERRAGRYGEFVWVDEDPRMNRLFYLASGSAPGEPQELTPDEPFSVDGFDISPNGRSIVFSARPSPDPSDSLGSDIYLMSLDDPEKKTRRLVDWPGSDRGPRFSPDGKRVAFGTSGGVESYYQNTEIAIVDVEAQGAAPRVLTEAFDEDARLMDWIGDSIYFEATQKTERALFRLSVAEDSEASFERLVGEPGWVLRGCTASEEGPRFGCLGERFDRFTEVYTFTVADPGLRRLTSFDDALATFDLSTREVIEWTSRDGTVIEGVLLKPRDFDPSLRYPLLFKIHGGPTGVDLKQRLTGSDRRYYPLEEFVHRGALVLMVNYRGSTGYGESFRSLNVNNLGIGDEWDVISGLDHLVDEGFVDNDRVGTMGWSQGGYISAFLSTKSGRFAAASVGAGISDWMTYYVNTDIHPFTRQYLSSTPWENRALYDETSPIHYIRNARTPTLIQHGENDRRVPLPNAFELYQGLRDRGVPTRLAVFPGFGHGINKPKANRAVMEQNLAWFEKWIWGTEETSQQQ